MSRRTDDGRMGPGDGRGRPVPRGDGRASDAVVERLAAMIAAGELVGGDRLPPERDLVRRFGVSRAVVREAITGLAGRGLLVTRPGHRPIVREPGYEAAVEAFGHFVGYLIGQEGGVRNLFESRIFIEAALARFAAANARREEIDELREALAANAAAIGDPEAFYASDVAFHGVLYRIPRNPIYPAVHKAYVDWLSGHWRRMERAPDIDRLNHSGHSSILEAIVARDPDGAEHALRRHLQIAWELVRSTFRRRPADVEAERSAPLL